MLREFHRKGELPPTSGVRGSSALVVVRKSARERIDLGQYPVGAVLPGIEQSGYPLIHPKFGSSNRQDAEDAKKNTKIIVAGLSPER